MDRSDTYSMLAGQFIDENENIVERSFGFRGGYFSACVRSEEELKPPYL